MKNTRRKLSRNRPLLIAVILPIIIVSLFFALSGVAKVKKLYYGYKASSALADESKKLDGPLKAIGFTKIEGGKSVCQNFKKYGYEGTPLDCTATLKSYQVFNDEASKTQANDAAKKISVLLKQNGWQQGNYELGQWFKDVMNNVDYNADAYHYKYFGKTFCVIDFFEAYSNPKPPAVQAMFSCTVPELHPPIY